MDGHITPSFAIGYNLRSPSPGKFLPPPSPANVFPLSNDIGGTPGTFYALIACLLQLICSIAFLFSFYFRAASPSPFSHLRPARLARQKRSKVFSCMTSMHCTPREELRGMPTRQAARLEPGCPGGISATNHRTVPRISTPTAAPSPALRSESRGAQQQQQQLPLFPCKSYLRELSHLPPGIVNKQTSSGILRTATGC